MAINKELNENELENVIGGPHKAEDLPDKFKQYGKQELSEDDLETIIGGPHKADELPDWAFTDKSQKFSYEEEEGMRR